MLISLMRYFLYIILSILLAACGKFDEKVALNYSSIIFATYNIQTTQKGIDNIVNAIQKIDADIIALQEVDSMTVRSSHHNPTSKRINQAKYIADKLGLNFYFCKAVGFEKGDYGVAILSKYPMKLREKFELPNMGTNEARVACAVNIKVPNYTKDIIAISTHLHFKQDELLKKQVGTLTHKFSSWFIKDDGVPIIMGDLNLFPNSKEYNLLTTTWTDTDKDLQYTAPSWNPDRKIDYILTSNANKWDVESVYVPKPSEKVTNKVTYSEVSDHLPLVVKMKLIEE